MLHTIEQRSIERSKQICTQLGLPASAEENPSVGRVEQLVGRLARGSTLGRNHPAAIWLDGQLKSSPSANRWGDPGSTLLALLEGEGGISLGELLDVDEADLPEVYQVVALLTILKATCRYRRSSGGRDKKVRPNGTQ